MQGLHYRAIDEHGHVHRGFTIEHSSRGLAQLMKQRGWTQLPGSGLQNIANWLGVKPRTASWSRLSAAVFALQLSQLLDAGVPLVSAVEELAYAEDKRIVRSELLELSYRVAQGGCLSEAMAQSAGLFSADYIACVSAGEASGELSRCLREQADNIRWQSEVSERVKTVLAYPIFALACLVCVFVFVLLYLVPAMLPLLSMSSESLPVYSQWLIALSTLTQRSGFALLCLSAMLVLGFFLLWQSNSAAIRFIQALLLRGSYGKILISFSLARYARSASLLYASGVEFTEAMRISQNLVSNALLRSQLSAASERILLGDSIASAMKSQKALPRLFVRMVTAGEHAGVMDVALRQCADQLQLSARYSLDRVERLIGPLLLLFIGGLLLWVVLAVMGPIYSVIAQEGAF